MCKIVFLQNMETQINDMVKPRGNKARKLIPRICTEECQKNDTYKETITAEIKAINDDKRKSSRRNDLVLDRKEKADIKTAISTASASCARYIANIKTEVRKTNFNFGMF
ncbi:MAG: hypothetical protein E6L00_08230 [Thaumarchaeota archaeon]|nr:MAG: hypothetical protein E6L00_08230 [Nitrososphaerota archaeon]